MKIISCNCFEEKAKRESDVYESLDYKLDIREGREIHSIDKTGRYSIGVDFIDGEQIVDSQLFAYDSEFCPYCGKKIKVIKVGSIVCFTANRMGMVGTIVEFLDNNKVIVKETVNYTIDIKDIWSK